MAGLNAAMTATNLNVQTSKALGGDGGVFHFANTGTTTITLTTPVFSTITASANGGIGSFSGTTMSLTTTDFSVDTCAAQAGYGGGFAFTNTGTTTLSFTRASVTTSSKAATYGGFIYQSGGTDFSLTLSTF